MCIVFRHDDGRRKQLHEKAMVSTSAAQFSIPVQESEINTLMNDFCDSSGK